MPREAGYSPAHMTLPAPIPDTSPALFPHPSPASDTKKGEVVMPREAGYSPAPIPNTSPALFPTPRPLLFQTTCPLVPRSLPAGLILRPSRTGARPSCPAKRVFRPHSLSPRGVCCACSKKKKKGEVYLARVSSPVYPRPCVSHARRYVGLFQEAAQPTGNARVTEFAERFAFDLAGAFAGDAEFATDFFEGA